MARLIDSVSPGRAQPIRIQPAQRHHLAQIPQVELAAASLFSESDLPLELRYQVTDPAVLRSALNESRIWVALGESGTVVGFARIEFVDDAVHLDEMDVLPAYGRRGIGTRLVQTVANWASSNGFSEITLITFRHLAWNAPFYEKLGFTRLETEELGAQLAALREEEAAEGINVGMRIAMKLELDCRADKP